MDFFQFNVPTKIVYGENLSADFAAELDLIPISKYFIVTDKIIRDLGLITGIEEGIKNAGREVTGIFSEVPSDSGVSVIEKCAALIKESGAEGIIAVGGGSVLDTAKGANILFSLGGNLVDDYSGAQTITQDLSPLIAIPTTAGTGSEVTEAIVVKDDHSATKLSFVDKHLLPTLAILDPALTTGLPPVITAATALDALTHAIESMMSVQKGPVSDALALQAISLVRDNLIPTLSDPQNFDLRGKLLVASTLAGIAFNHAMVGVVHAVAHTIGALFHVHHGTANGIFLPFGMEYNLDERTEAIASMAAALQVKNPDADLKKRALQVIEAVKSFREEVKKVCGLKTTLSEVGVTKADLATLAEKSPDDGASFYNPREVNASDLLPYLEKAF
ncbi:iron-containing alcohol dehydrogenase [bacterium]|nr:iron-containing alcohol dehydrogenase [bacterium]